MEELNDPAVWRRDDSAKEYSCTRDADENSLLFVVKWDDTSFPVLYPGADVKDAAAVKGARYLEFEAKSWQDKVENDMYHMKVIFVWRDGSVKENGFAPCGRHLKYWLRNVRVLK